MYTGGKDCVMRATSIYLDLLKFAWFKILKSFQHFLGVQIFFQYQNNSQQGKNSKISCKRIDIFKGIKCIFNIDKQVLWIWSWGIMMYIQVITVNLGSVLENTVNV